MITSSTASHDRTAKPSEFRKQFQIAALGVHFNRYLQALKKTPVVCENTFFNTTNFHRFHVHSFKLFSSQLNDQMDSDSLININMFQISNPNDLLDTFHEQKQLVRRNSKMKSSMPSLKQTPINHLKLMFP